MSSLLSKPWFLAVLSLVILLGTQAGAFYIYWADLFPAHHTEVLVVKREDPSSLQWSFSSEHIVKLQSELEGRLAEVEKKEVELQVFETRLEADRAEVDEIKSKVEQMRDTLLADIVKVEEWEKQNLKSLASTYSNLDPLATVSIFSELNDPTVAKIMRFMKPDIVGDILQEMATQDGGNEVLIKRAARLSDILRLFTDDNVDPS